MAAEQRKKTSHLVTSPDPDIYLDFYRKFSPKEETLVDQVFKFKMDNLHEIFKDGAITGERLLEIGTGPSQHTVYTVSKWFEEITLSDVSEKNLEVLREWKAGKRGWDDSALKYMINLNGNGEDLLSVNQRFSKQVKSIVRGDLRQKNLLAGTKAEGVMFDAVVLCLCQNSASSCREEYIQAVSNYTRLLKTGGHVIAIDTLGQTFYCVGEHKFPQYCVRKEDVISMYKESGYEILYWKDRDKIYNDKSRSDLDGLYALVGRKL